MKHTSALLNRLLMFSCILIGVGLLGLYLTLNIEALRHPILVELFAITAIAGCICMIAYSVIYVIERIRDGRK